MQIVLKVQLIVKFISKIIRSIVSLNWNIFNILNNLYFQHKYSKFDKNADFEPKGYAKSVN